MPRKTRDSLKAATHPSTDKRMTNTPTAMMPCGNVSPASDPALLCIAYAPTAHNTEPKIRNTMLATTSVILKQFCAALNSGEAAEALLNSKP
jgi:hypothetical protein